MKTQRSAGMIVKTNSTISQMSSIALLQRKRSIDPKNTFILLQGKPLCFRNFASNSEKKHRLNINEKKTIQEYPRQMSAVWSDILSLPARLC